MLERSIVKTIDATLNIYARLLMSPPRVMDELSGFHILQCAIEYVPPMRILGHKGMLATVYLQDGMRYASFLRHQRARHRLL